MCHDQWTNKHLSLTNYSCHVNWNTTLPVTFSNLMHNCLSALPSALSVERLSLRHFVCCRNVKYLTTNKTSPAKRLHDASSVLVGIWFIVNLHFQLSPLASKLLVAPRKWEQNVSLSLPVHSLSKACPMQCLLLAASVCGCHKAQNRTATVTWYIIIFQRFHLLNLLKGRPWDTLCLLQKCPVPNNK